MFQKYIKIADRQKEKAIRAKDADRIDLLARLKFLQTIH
jgi:hypothetical protein